MKSTSVNKIFSIWLPPAKILFFFKKNLLFSRPLATSEDDKTAICQALDNLIDECTLILGWCYSQDHVRKTKVQQRDLSRAALGKMHIYCPDSTSTQIHIPTDQFAEKAQLASPLKPTVFETSSANAKLVSMLVFVGWQFLIMLW